MVDPKKVELTLFNKIERHYLAKLPDSEDAIITDNTKVINTLNSLCIGMDARYDLLKNAMVRNIKEYNTKFKARKSQKRILRKNALLKAQTLNAGNHEDHWPIVQFQ